MVEPGKLLTICWGWSVSQPRSVNTLLLRLPEALFNAGFDGFAHECGDFHAHQAAQRAETVIDFWRDARRGDGAPTLVGALWRVFSRE